MPEERATPSGAALSTGLSRRAVLGAAAAAHPVQTAQARLLGAVPAVSAIGKRSRLVDYEVVELAALMRARVVTAVQVTTAYLDRIDRFNGPFETYGDNGLYNAFVRIDRDGARAQAAAADTRFARARHTHEDLPPLLGIPFGVKDSVAVKGLDAKDGSHAFDGNAAPRDATVVHRLREAGARAAARLPAPPSGYRRPAGRAPAAASRPAHRRRTPTTPTTWPPSPASGSSSPHWAPW